MTATEFYFGILAPAPSLETFEEVYFLRDNFCSRSILTQVLSSVFRHILYKLKIYRMFYTNIFGIFFLQPCFMNRIVENFECPRIMLKKQG